MMNISICKSELLWKQNNGIAWKKTVHWFLFTFLIWWSNDAIILIEIFRKMLLRGFTSNIYQEERSLSDKNTENFHLKISWQHNANVKSGKK